MNRSLFSITRYMNRVCFKVSGGTSVPKLPPCYPPRLMASALPYALIATTKPKEKKMIIIIKKSKLAGRTIRT